MFIVLTILKIIGIILLVIAAILAVILFAPFVYEADGDSRKTDAHIKIRWLFGLLRFRFSYEHHAAKFTFHILSFRILPREGSSGEKRQKVRFRKKRGKTSLRKEDTFFFENEQQEETGENKKGEEQEAAAHEYKGASVHVSPPPSFEQQRDTVTPKARRAGVSTGGKKFSRKFRKGRSTFRKNRSGHSAADENRLFQTLRQGIRLFRKYREKELFGRLFHTLMRFLTRIRPRRASGDIVFGFEDPALTGRVLGAVAMLPFVFQTDLKIQPDFETEKSYFQGNFYLKGHIQLFFVLVLVLRLLRNKDFRSFLSKARNIR